MLRALVSREGARVPRLAPGALADRNGIGRARQRHRPPGIGVVLLANLHHVDRPRESRLVGVRRVAPELSDPICAHLC
jgi:hypothetical protein